MQNRMVRLSHESRQAFADWIAGGNGAPQMLAPAYPPRPLCASRSASHFRQTTHPRVDIAIRTGVSAAVALYGCGSEKRMWAWHRPRIEDPQFVTTFLADRRPSGLPPPSLANRDSVRASQLAEFADSNEAGTNLRNLF